MAIKFKNLSVSPGFSIETGDGWKKLITKCFIELDSLNIRIKILQVKQKFGGLSIYYDLNDVDNLKVEKVVRKYISQAYKTCEKCGSIENVSTEIITNFYTRCKKCYLKVKS